MRLAAVIALAVLLSACASRAPVVESALIDPTVERTNTEVGDDYRIGPTDKLRLTVFQVKDLSFDEIRVDASGNLQLPLIGSIRAAGSTPAELSREIERRLGERYLRDPQVSVAVSEASSQKVTVDGAVTKPGVYEMQGRTTLTQAVAMAEGATRVADLGRVAVFRMDGDRRQAAVFDLAAIRRGAAADPVLRGDDVVVVDTSRLSAAWRDIVAALPALSVFAYVN